MDRKNLTVMTKTQALRIVIEGGRAIGVEVLQEGKRQILKAAREVILCGGAFNSPHLLMLSGIGDPAELKRHGLEVNHALPGVGKNLQDHLDFILSYKSKETDLFGVGPLATINLIKAIIEWRKDGTGMIATPFAEGGAFVKSSPEEIRPDLQLHFVISIVDDHARKLHLGYGMSCHVCVLRPYSRGTVSLENADPLAPPVIDPNYLSDERDLMRLLAGVKKVRKLLLASPLARYRAKEIYTEGVESDTELIEHIRNRADTIYHPVGTCKMGRGPDAVVDPRFRVHGVAQLRVVDASVMPTLIGGNTNAPTVMMAERAAEWIKADARSVTTHFSNASAQGAPASATATASLPSEVPA